MIIVASLVLGLCIWSACTELRIGMAAIALAIATSKKVPASSENRT